MSGSSNIDGNWQGDAAIETGLGVFRGRVGDNKPHQHWAHQVTIGLGEAVNFEFETDAYAAAAVVFPSGVAHRLLPGEVFAIYIDPSSKYWRELFVSSPPLDEPTPLARDQLTPLLASFGIHSVLAEVVNDLRFGQTPDEHLQKIVSALQQSQTDGEPLSLMELADIRALSPSRFSHWFVEQTGVPLRSYKKWLKLKSGIEAMLAGHSLVEAALIAGFADQAHFSRSFSSAFGIRLSDIIATPESG